VAAHQVITQENRMSDADVRVSRLRGRKIKAVGAPQATGNTGPTEAAPSADNTPGCPDTTKTGDACRMRPTPSGWCMTHDPGRSEQRLAERRRGGSLTAARKRLAQAKHDAIAQLGISEPLPSLDSVESCQEFVVQTAGRVLRREISPAQGNTLVNLVRLSKDLIGLAVDVKLAEMLEQGQ
jgi:hypothetical protein